MSIQDIDRELAAIQEQLRPLWKRREQLTAERDQLLSRQWIEINGVTPANTQSSNPPGVWFSHIEDYRRWLSEQSTPKQFCEWNGRIYFTSEILAGRIDQNAPARIDDLEMLQRLVDAGNKLTPRG